VSLGHDVGHDLHGSLKRVYFVSDSEEGLVSVLVLPNLGDSLLEVVLQLPAEWTLLLVEGVQDDEVVGLSVGPLVLQSVVHVDDVFVQVVMIVVPSLSVLNVSSVSRSRDLKQK